MAPSILITGSTGFIGSKLLLKILATSKSVGVLLLLRRNSVIPQKILSHPNITVMRIDFPKEFLPHTILDGIKIVYHVAGTMSDWAREEDFEAGNVLLTQELLRAVSLNLNSKKPTIKRFVHVSTADVYGHPGNNPTEWAPLEGLALPFGYASTKTRADILVRTAFIEEGLPTVMLRPATVYGPGSKDVVSEIANLLTKESMILISKGRAKAGLVYIDDMVDALLLAGSVKGIEGEAFNVCGGIGTGGVITWKEYVDMIADELKVKRAKVSIPFYLALFVGFLFEKAYALVGSYKNRPLVTRMAVYVTGRSQNVDISKSEKFLGFNPKMKVAEGIKRSLAWWNQQTESPQ